MAGFSLIMAPGFTDVKALEKVSKVFGIHILHYYLLNYE